MGYSTEIGTGAVLGSGMGAVWGVVGIIALVVIGALLYWYFRNK